jgi:hypothetical protein
MIAAHNDANEQIQQTRLLGPRCLWVVNKVVVKKNNDL